jgi:hypothetical protein
MKDFMDRLIPMAQPYMLLWDHHYIHPPRYPGSGSGKFVLISNAGYPERHHFSGPKETFRRFTDSPDDELAGVICSAGGALLQSPALQQHTAWYLEAAKRAGREVVAQGRISAETQAVLDRPLVEDPAVYVSIVNSFWESQGVGMIEFDDGGRAAALSSEAVAHGTRLPPSTGSDAMRDLVAGMAAALNPEAAGDLEAVI